MPSVARSAVILAVSMLSSTVVAILLERIAYRPLRRAPRLVPLITAIGASSSSQQRPWHLRRRRQGLPEDRALEGLIDPGIPC